MRRKDILLMALALCAMAGWLVFRSPYAGSGKKEILKERIRAADSALQTLDAERAAGRERLRLARKKADENRARSARAAAALPLYEHRRKEAAMALKDRKSFENVTGSRIESGMTEKRRGDGTEQTAVDNAVLLRRLNALLQ